MCSGAVRLTIKTAKNANAYEEATKIAEFLYARCGGDVAEAAVLAFVRRCGAEIAANPHTKPGYSEAMLRLIKAADQ